MTTIHAPMTEAECHRLHGHSILDGEGCRCFLTDGGFLACPAKLGRATRSGDFCQDCGAANMVRTGTCLTCQSCGSSSGGCS